MSARTEQAKDQRGPIVRARLVIGGLSDGVRDRWAAAPKWQRWIVFALALLAAIAAPADVVGAVMSPYSDWGSLLFNPIGTYILLAIGLSFVIGQAGMLDLGFVAFYGISAYTLAYFGVTYGFAFWPTLVMGLFVAIVSGVVLGGPTLRLRGDYLAIVTLGFGEIVRITAINVPALGGPRPDPGPAPAAGLRHRVPARPAAVLLPDPDVHRAGDRDVGAPGAQPGGPGVDGDPRGRGRGRADRRADDQVQAARVRARRDGRGPGRGHVRWQA